MVVIDEEDACTPPKKKHKKDHKHKHKKHSAEKTKKHKKHKKHKHGKEQQERKSPAVVASSNKSDRFTPELTPKRGEKKVVVVNGQVAEKVVEATEVVVKSDAKPRKW